MNNNPSILSSTLTIQHRGFDNFLYVMDQMRKRQFEEEKSLGKIVVAGSSAGSYGASLNFPWVKEILGSGKKVKSFLVSDGGVGVITGAFLDDTLYGESSSWNIDANLHLVFDDFHFVMSCLFHFAVAHS